MSSFQAKLVANLPTSTFFETRRYFSGLGVYQDLRFGFRLAVVIGIWLMPTPMPPRTFGGYFPRAFSAAAFVLNGFEILSG
jgi:hypothetical protein